MRTSQAIGSFRAGKLKRAKTPLRLSLENSTRNLVFRLGWVTSTRLAITSTHRVKSFFLVYDVEIERGVPECREVAEMQWITLADLLELELPPADKPVLERIRRDIYT